MTSTEELIDRYERDIKEWSEEVRDLKNEIKYRKQRIDVHRGYIRELKGEAV